jgi:deoxycytidylate deaminase
MGIKTKGASLYMSCGIPCKDCLKAIINSGVKEIVVTKITFYDMTSKFILEYSNLKYRIFSHLTNLVNDEKY